MNNSYFSFKSIRQHMTNWNSLRKLPGFPPASFVSQWLLRLFQTTECWSTASLALGPLLSWTCIFSQGNFTLLISLKYHFYATDFLIYIFVLISCLSPRFICNCLFDSSTQKWTRLLKQHLQNRAFSSCSPLISTNWHSWVPQALVYPSPSLSTSKSSNKSCQLYLKTYPEFIQFFPSSLLSTLSIHFLIPNLIFEFNHPFNKKLLHLTN